MTRDTKKHYYISFGIILFLALLERLYNITQIGLSPSDATSYWDTAKQWSQGNLLLTKHYRPLVYFFYSLAIQVFGEVDYALKVFNALFDGLNITMVFILAKYLLKRPFATICVTFLYAFSYLPIMQSRGELVHIASTFPTLFSFFFFARSLAINELSLKKHLFYLFLSGLGVSAAANTHPELIVLSFLYFAIYLYKIIKVFYFSQRYSFFIQYLAQGSAFFTLGASLIFFIFMAIFGPGDVISCIVGNTKEQVGSDVSLLHNYKRALFLFPSKTSSLLITILFYLGVVYTLIKRFLFRQKSTVHTWLIIFTTLGYIFFYVLLVPKHMIARLFMPFTPLIFIFIYYFWQKILNKSRSVLLIFTLILTWSGRNYSSQLSFSFNQKPKIYRYLYNTLKNKVNENNRLLVAPSIMYHDRSALQYSVYFGKNADFLLQQYRYQSWDELIKERKIRYIVISLEDLDYRVPVEDYWGAKKLHQIKSHLLQTHSPYTLEHEKKVIHNIAQRYQAKILYQNEYGILYELSNFKNK